MKEFHISVLPAEVIAFLRPRPNEDFIDCTFGGGGHSADILEKTSPGGRLLAIDLDPLALKKGKSKVSQYGKRIRLVRGNFKNLAAIAAENKFREVSGILLDLGLSSGQLADKERGFSFDAEGNLDMRFGPEILQTAFDLINDSSEERLIDIFKNFGEERLAKPLAQKIVSLRKSQPIVKAGQLVAIAAAVYGQYYRTQPKINPATKIFQALRIAVNDELDNLVRVLPQTLSLLRPGGRLAVISFHSLEDRIVKEFMRRESRDCLCPPIMPVCQCNHNKSLKIITKKPVIAELAELAENPRARSAKLRVAEKI